MKKKILVYLCALFAIASLQAKEELANALEIHVAKEHVLDKQQHHFLTTTDYSITPKVNPITGEYSEEEVDLIVAGSEPLSLRRFYNSSSPYDPRYATWRYNPEAFFVANFECDTQEKFASIGDVNGGVTSLKKDPSKPHAFRYEVAKSFLALFASGVAHPLNTHLTFHKVVDPKNKHRHKYLGTLKDGTGRERHFASTMHSWNRRIYWTERSSGLFSGYSEKCWRILPNTWTPYHIPITETKLPNGNVLVYSYTSWKKEKKKFPLPQLLHSITAYNADKTKVLGTLELHYPRAKHDEVAGIRAIGSDGRTAIIEHRGKSPINLASASCPGKPQATYAYNNHSLHTVAYPEGRHLKTEYTSDGKVAAQYAPVGPHGEMHPIGRYTYEKNRTIMTNAEGHEIHYLFNDNKRLLATAYFQEGKLYKKERLQTDTKTGNICSKTIENGEGAVLITTKYTYDKNHNPIEEKRGNKDQWRTIERQFSDDGFNNVLFEKDRKDKCIKTTYVPNTNLIASQIVYHKEKPCQRTFNTYDDCAICIKTIVDDGISTDPRDLTGITFRKITYVTPKASIPCFGLPEIVEEKTLNAKGEEILLHKTVYTYTPFGQVLQEDHFDATNTYRYSLYNTYDENERLISKTDPQGNLTTFTYDKNHNLTSIAGPREDQYKEIAYDKANRPLQITDWQTDGTKLTLQKKYNKLGQVTEEIDPCGNTTSYTYDALGRVTAILYPDGALEQKEYDPLGNVVKHTDANGYETHTTYNVFQEPLSISYPDGSNEHFTYDATGNVQTHTDTNGATTHYTYDIFDHKTSEKTLSATGELLKSKTYTWSPFLLLSETESGVTTTYTYDFAGRKIQEKKGYMTSSYTYDPLGRLTTIDNGTFKTIEEHDLLGNVIERRVETDSELKTRKQMSYDSGGFQNAVVTSQGNTTIVSNTLGQPLSITNALGFTTHYSYTFKNSLIKTLTNPKGIQTVTVQDSRGRNGVQLKKNAQGETLQKSVSQYDQNGNLIEQTHTLFSGTTPIKTLTHTWEYGPKNRLERFLEAGKKETRYLYDQNGRLKTIVKPNGSHLMHEYDELGRLKRHYAHDFDYHYTYDALDRVVVVYDAHSNTRTTRAYDALGHLLQETLGNNLSLATTYDTLGRKTKLTLPDSTTVHFSYDGPFLHEVTRNQYIHTYSQRNLEGQVTNMVTPTGPITIERDPLGRILSFLSLHFLATNYCYDPVGNLVKYHYKDPLGLRTSHFAYDDLNQLIAENEHTYAFDSLHNRRQCDETPYSINDLCQITAAGKTTYEYDLNGNLIFDGKKTYAYDSLDRLISVTENNHRTTYTYDPFNRRLSKTCYVDNEPINTIRYLWDYDDEIGAVNEENTLFELRVLGEGLGAEIGAAVLFELNETPLIPIHDHRGALATLIDPTTNTPVETYRYTAFGEPLTLSSLSPWGFSSKRVDQESGLLFFGRRYYLPKLGRFITQDPNGFDDGPNLYAYVKNAPLIYIDPFGLKASRFSGSWILASKFSMACERTQELYQKIHKRPCPSFETNFKNKSRIFDLKKKHNRPDLPGGKGIFYVNGMNTTFETCEKHLLHLSNLAGGYNITATYNANHDFFTDTTESYGNLHGIPTDPVDRIREMWDNYFANAPPDAYALHFCTSQGAILTKLALENYEHRDRIRVIAIAPATYIARDKCRSVDHFITKNPFRDPIPRINLWGRFCQRKNVHKLPSHPDADKFDHSFTSPTYVRTMEEQIKDYIEGIDRS